MKKILGAVLVLSFSGVAFAADYGDAGCGLGSMAFQGKKDATSQIFAATTNGTFGSQTFGITFGTSNCNDKGLIKVSEARRAYIESNYKEIAKDAARGNGEYLTNLASLYGYTNNTDTFASIVRSNYEQIFASNSAKVAVDQLDRIVNI